jgi:hypothetical protein
MEKIMQRGASKCGRSKVKLRRLKKDEMDEVCSMQSRGEKSYKISVAKGEKRR